MTEKSTRDRILDAAERLFSEHGGENGVSMRELAAGAEVKLSLLSYHFGGKGDLYRAVFARRASELAEARDEALTKVMENPSAGIEDLVEAFLRPSIAMRYASDRQGAAFALLTTFEASDPREAERGILAQHYDPTALRFLAALSQLYPNATRQAATEAYLFMTGALVMSLVSGSRFTRLGSHEMNPEQPSDIDALTRQLIRFRAGGTNAILSVKYPAGE